MTSRTTSHWPPCLVFFYFIIVFFSFKTFFLIFLAEMDTCIWELICENQTYMLAENKICLKKFTEKKFVRISKIKKKIARPESFSGEYSHVLAYITSNTKRRVIFLCSIFELLLLAYD